MPITLNLIMVLFLFILSDKTEKIKMKITRHYKSLLSAIISVALFYSAAAHADILDLHARKLWQHDYVRLPELVEDVCNAYKKYGQDLTGHYLEVLKPCIVCFRADIDYEKGALEAALSYAYTSVRELPPDSGAVFGIDRHGKSVSVDEIVNVEFI